MSAINYSIIIPHYDIPHLLMRCLSSIPNRDDVQVIVVDDKSPGCEMYLSEYPLLSSKNIEFHILKENGGGGRARNEGLKYAKGKWLIFADADDFFNYCFNDILDEYKNASQDIIYFNANSIDSVTYKNSPRSGYINCKIEAYFACPEKNDSILRYLWGEPWGKIVKHQFVKKYNISFGEVPIHNDSKFAYLIGYYAQSVSADVRAMYCVTHRNNSVSRVLTDQLYFVRIRVITEAYCFLTAHGINDLPLISDLIYETLLHFKVTHKKQCYDECVRIMESLGVDRKLIEKSIKKEFRKRRIHNRKVFFKLKILEFLDRIIKL